MPWPMTSSPSDNHSFTVELSIATDDADQVARFLASVLDRLSALPQAGVLLLGMPAVSKPGPSNDSVQLRWVGIHGRDSDDAVQQVTSTFSQLVSPLPVKTRVARAEAHEE